VKQEQKDRASQSDDDKSRQLGAALKAQSDAEAKCATLAEKVEGLLTLIRQEREERAGETALHRKKAQELQSRIAELDTRLQRAPPPDTSGETLDSVKMRLNVAENEAKRLRAELNTAIDSAREQSKHAAEKLDAVETKRFELERDVAELTEERALLEQQLRDALAESHKPSNSVVNASHAAELQELHDRLEEEQDRLERTQQAATKALEAARRAAAALSETEEAKAQTDQELQTTKFEFEKLKLMHEGLRIKLADHQKNARLSMSPDQLAQHSRMNELQKRVAELEKQLAERPAVGFADGDLTMKSPTGSPAPRRRQQLAVGVDDAGYESADDDRLGMSPMSPLGRTVKTADDERDGGADAGASGGGADELRTKLEEAESERVRLLDANKKLREERDALQEELRVAKEASGADANNGDAPITGGPPPPMMGGGGGPPPPPPPPPMPKFKEKSTTLVIKKTDKSELNKSGNEPKTAPGGASTAAIVDAIKSGVKLRKAADVPRKPIEKAAQPAGLVDLSNLGMLASTIARERRQRAAVTEQRMQNVLAEQDAIGKQPAAKVEPAFPKLRPVGLPKGESGRSPGAAVRSAATTEQSPAVSPSLSRLHPLRPAGAARPGADRPTAGASADGLRRATTMTPEMRQAFTDQLKSGGPPPPVSPTAAGAAGASTARTPPMRPTAALQAKTSASRASYATTRPNAALAATTGSRTPTASAAAAAAAVSPAASPMNTASRASFAGIERSAGRARGATSIGAPQPVVASVTPPRAPVAQSLAPAIAEETRLAAMALNADMDDDESTEEIPTIALPSLPPAPAAGSGAANGNSGNVAKNNNNNNDDDDDDGPPPPLPSTPVPSAGATAALSSSTTTAPAAAAATTTTTMTTSGEVSRKADDDAKKEKKKKKKSSSSSRKEVAAMSSSGPAPGLTRHNSSYRNHDGLDSMIATLEDDGAE
jgi:hypothetical protein